MSGMRRLKTIEVRLIPQDAYPAFRSDRDHAYSHLTADRRLGEVIDICAKVHAQAILERSGRKTGSEKMQKAG